MPSERYLTSENPHRVDWSTKLGRRQRWFTVYVNAAGRTAMAKAVTFPRGSVIVKEKLRTPNEATPELLTAMLKREAGYDPQGGDWEYLALSGDGKKVQARGKLPHCRSCHAERRTTDFIYRTYVAKPH